MVKIPAQRNGVNIKVSLCHQGSEGRATHATSLCKLSYRKNSILIQLLSGVKKVELMDTRG